MIWALSFALGSLLLACKLDEERRERATYSRGDWCQCAQCRTHRSYK